MERLSHKLSTRSQWGSQATEPWGLYMDLDERIFERAFAPYRKESVHCLLLDIVISIIGFGMFMLMNIPEIDMGLFLVFPVYFLVEIFVNYRISILTLIEEHLLCVVRKDVTIENCQLEYSPSGRWGSVIPKLYPSIMKVARYKIMCTDENGKKVKLRSVMSLKNVQRFRKMVETTSHPQSVIIGKYSRIILKYCDKNDNTFVLNRRI